MKINLPFLFVLFLFCFGINTLTFSQNSNEETENDFGYLKIEILNQDSVHVIVNDDFETLQKIVSGDTLALIPGRNSIRIISQHYLDMVRNYDVEEGQMKEVRLRMKPFLDNKELSRRSSYPRIFWEANNFILTDPDTDLYIDGLYVGRHYVIIDTAESFKVTGINESGVKLTKTLQPDDKSFFNFHKLFMKPSRKKARLLSFVPGGSQLYKRQKFKGIAFSMATIGGLSLAFYYESQIWGKKREFKQLNSEYQSATDPEEVFTIGVEIERTVNESVKFSNRRDNILLGTTLVYLANIVDGFIAPKIGFRNESLKIDPYLDFDSQYRQAVVGIKSSF